MLITFANRLEPDQAPHFVEKFFQGFYLDPNYLTLIVFLKEFFKKVDFEKKQNTDHKNANSLDPDQAQKNVWPNLDPNCLTL